MSSTINKQHSLITPFKKPEQAAAPVVRSPPTAPVAPPNTTAMRAHQGQNGFDAGQGAPAGAGPGSAQPATSRQPLNLRSMQAAEEDHERNKNMGIATTRAFINLMERHSGDPDYLAALVDRAKEPHSGVLDYMMGPLNGAFMKDSGGDYVSGFTDEDRQTIVDTLGAARERGYLSDQEIRDRATHSPGWQDVAARLGVDQVGHDPSTETATRELQQAQRTYASADRSVKEKEERLARELASFGPALDDEQRAAYIQAFREDPVHKEAYTRQAQAAEALAQTLDTHREALQNASVTDPRVREQVYEALKEVAHSESPRAALEFYRDIVREPNAPLAQAFAQYGALDSEVLQPALGGTAGQLLAENGGDAQGAMAQLQELVGPIKEAWETWGAPANDARNALGDIQEAWEAIEQAANGQYDRLAGLAEDWNGKSSLFKGLAVAGVVLGAAGAGNELRQGNYLQAVQSLADSGQQGLELLAGATKSLADAGKLAQYTDKALSFARFAERLAPGLGVVAGSASFVANLQRAGEGQGNIGFAVAAIGDAVGVLGSAASMVPGGQPAGALMSGIGAFVSAGGELLGNWVDHRQFTDEQRRFLEAAGVTGDLQAALMGANPQRVRELTEGLGLSPGQVQELVGTYSRLLEGTGRGLVLENFTRMTEALGLDGAQAFGLLQSIGQGMPDANAAIEGFMDRLQRETPTPHTAEEWRRALHTIATEPRNADGLRQVYGNADRFLQGLGP
jgi:hypothetical protein